MADRIVFSFLLLARVISSTLSIRSRNKFGKIIGWILMNLSAKRRAITFDNIQKAFPERSKSEVEKILRDSYYNLGITLSELIVMDKFSEDELHQLIQYDNIDLIWEVLKRNKGVIVLSAHYGNWELLANTGSRFSKVVYNIVAKPQKNKLVNEYLYKTRSTNYLNYLDSDKSAKALLVGLKKNQAIAMIVDQSAKTHSDLKVDFFGRKAWTYEAPAKLSLKYDVPLLFGLTYRNEDGTYSGDFVEIDRSGLDDSEEGILELTQRHVKYLEDKIRERPSHWSWQHRRWKNT